MLNQGLNDASVGLVQQVADLCNGKPLVPKQIANRNLALVLGEQLRCILRHDEGTARQLERFFTHGATCEPQLQMGLAPRPCCALARAKTKISQQLPLIIAPDTAKV